MTNARALDAVAAARIVRDAAETAVAATPRARIILRGDSTLRGHLLPEYLALRDAAFGGLDRTLLLVPALPAAGRVTINGVHCLKRGTEYVPLEQSEYANDGDFSYHSARLLDWAEERSAGHFPARAGLEVPLDVIRSRGPVAVTEAILALRGRGPAILAPDAQTIADLQTIASGLDTAERLGVQVIVRCAPTFAAVTSGALATGFAAPPSPSGGLLIVCGSYVSNTGQQLADLRAAMRVEAIEVDVDGVIDAASVDREVRRVATTAAARLGLEGIALISTPRERHPSALSLDAGARIASALGHIVRAIDPPPGVVLAKGGITSQVALTVGFSTDEARVVGPLAAGVSLWDVTSGGRHIPYVVFPGNTGDARALTAVVGSIMRP